MCDTRRHHNITPRASPATIRMREEQQIVKGARTQILIGPEIEEYKFGEREVANAKLATI